jgi:hypothetical protein
MGVEYFYFGDEAEAKAEAESGLSQQDLFDLS